MKLLAGHVHVDRLIHTDFTEVPMRQSILTRRDPTGGLWEPDTLLPSQHNPQRPPTELSGVRRLKLAVIEDAVNLYRTRSMRDPQYQEVAAWLATDDPDWPFSFTNCCAAVGLDPDYIRRGLREHPAAHPRRLHVVRPKPAPIWPPEARPWPADRVCALRQRMGVSLTMFARRLGVGHSEPARWERGVAYVPAAQWATLEAWEAACS
jgi:hypothetical protein